jgi:hypothetical protein
MAQSIPDADAIFSRFFDPWYEDDDRRRKGFEHTRPDMLGLYRPGLDLTALSRLNRETETQVFQQMQMMLDAARTDWPRYLQVTGDVDEHWIQKCDDYYDVDQIAALIERSDPADFANDFIVMVCEFGAALGHVLHRLQPRLRWIPEWPYWESSLYDPVSGNVIPPFHWAIKKFSDYGVDDGFVPKIHWCVELLDRPADSGGD